MTNHSMHDADRATHVKIVVIALLAAGVVVAVGIAARTEPADAIYVARAIKAKSPATLTVEDPSVDVHKQRSPGPVPQFTTHRSWVHEC
ncbi:hypothetical protein ES707_07201 [subsurface metagenome]